MNTRDSIATVAASAGSAYAAMQALDLLEKPAAAQKQPFKLQPTGGSKRIIILGFQSG